MHWLHEFEGILAIAFANALIFFMQGFHSLSV